MRSTRVSLCALFLVVPALTGCAHVPIVGDLTASPSPSPPAVTITGHANQDASTPFHLNAGNYRVEWFVPPEGSLVAAILNPASLDPLLDVTPPHGSTGEVSYHATGGDYTLQIAKATVDWKVTFSFA